MQSGHIASTSGSPATERFPRGRSRARPSWDPTAHRVWVAQCARDLKAGVRCRAHASLPTSGIAESRSHERARLGGLAGRVSRVGKGASHSGGFRDTPECGVGWTTGAGGGVREHATEGRGRPRYVAQVLTGPSPTRARVLSGPEMAHPRSCPRPVGGFTRVLRSPDLKWPVRFCQTGPVAPRRRGRSRHSLGRALLPWFFGQDNGPPPGQ